MRRSPSVVGLAIDDERLTVGLSDGRVLGVPIAWYPRLSHASPEDRALWELIGRGHGIHWPELDEDVSVENLLLGQPSGEGGRSFARWKEWYQKRRSGTEAPPSQG